MGYRDMTSTNVFVGVKHFKGFRGGRRMYLGFNEGL